MRILSDIKILLAAVVLLGAAAAQAKPADPAAVKALLEARDGGPFTVELWRGLGDGVDRLLANAALDGKARVLVRARALAALGALGGDTARTTIAAVLDDRSAVPALLASAVQAYGGFAKTHNDAVIAAATRLLAHDDWLVRRAAAVTLGRIGTVQAAMALRARRPVESHAGVLRAIEQALGEK